jgi:hypothetical protein
MTPEQKIVFLCGGIIVMAIAVLVLIRAIVRWNAHRALAQSVKDDGKIIVSESERRHPSAPHAIYDPIERTWTLRDGTVVSDAEVMLKDITPAYEDPDPGDVNQYPKTGMGSTVRVKAPSAILEDRMRTLADELRQFYVTGFSSSTWEAGYATGLHHAAEKIDFLLGDGPVPKEYVPGGHHVDVAHLDSYPTENSHQDVAHADSISSFK